MTGMNSSTSNLHRVYIKLQLFSDVIDGINEQFYFWFCERSYKDIFQENPPTTWLSQKQFLHKLLLLGPTEAIINIFSTAVNNKYRYHRNFYATLSTQNLLKYFFSPFTAKDNLSRLKPLITSRIMPEHCNGAKSRKATARAVHARHQYSLFSPKFRQWIKGQSN